MNSDSLVTSGFTNDLFFTMEDLEDQVPSTEGETGSSSKPRNFKWSLASYGNSNDAENGK